MDTKKLDSLYDLKAQKLKEQKALSDNASSILEKLNESSRQCRKNLVVAVAISRQPGYLEYYQPPEEIKAIENERVLNKLASQIRAKHKELEQIDKEIMLSTPKPVSSEIQSPSISSISQWFDIYGRTKHEAEKDMLTTFSPSPKIYGGTAHHRSFKTSATVMRKGHLTR